MARHRRPRVEDRRAYLRAEDAPRRTLARILSSRARRSRPDFQVELTDGFLHQPPDARGVELKVRSASDKPQTLTVEMRGKMIDTQVLSDHEWHSLSYSIPPSKSTPAGGEWLVLRVNPPWKVRGDRRTLGVMTRDLKWIN